MVRSLQTWFAGNPPHTGTDRYLFWAAWLLHAPLPFFLVYALSDGDWRNIIGNALAIVVCFVPRWMEARSEHRFPAEGELVIGLTLFVELLGRTFHLYERFSPYDTLAHALECGAITFFLVLLVYAFLVEHDVDYDGWFIVVVGLGIGVAVGGAWEIFEWSIDLLFQAGYQAGLQDTMIDLAFGAAGALAATLLAMRYRRGHSRAEITEELPIFYDWL